MIRFTPLWAEKLVELWPHCPLSEHLRHNLFSCCDQSVPLWAPCGNFSGRGKMTKQGHWNGCPDCLWHIFCTSVTDSTLERNSYHLSMNALGPLVWNRLARSAVDSAELSGCENLFNSLIRFMSRGIHSILKVAYFQTTTWPGGSPTRPSLEEYGP